MISKEEVELLNRQYQIVVEKAFEILKYGHNEPNIKNEINHALDYENKIRFQSFEFGHIDRYSQNKIYVYGSFDNWLVWAYLGNSFQYGTDVIGTPFMSERDKRIWKFFDQRDYDVNSHRRNKDFTFFFKKDGDNLPQEMAKLFYGFNQHLIDMYGVDV